MNNESITALLSETGTEYIEKFGVVAYLKYFFFVIGKKLEAKTISETAARVACDRAEALAMCINK